MRIIESRYHKTSWVLFYAIHLQYDHSNAFQALIINHQPTITTTTSLPADNRPVSSESGPPLIFEQQSQLSLGPLPVTSSSNPSTPNRIDIGPAPPRSASGIQRWQGGERYGQSMWYDDDYIRRRTSSKHLFDYSSPQEFSRLNPQFKDVKREASPRNNGRRLAGPQDRWMVGRDPSRNQRDYREGYDYNRFGRPSETLIQGNSHQTWSSTSPYHNQDAVVQMYNPTGRPLHARMELWEGPNHSPLSVDMWSEDGGRRPFRTVVATPDEIGRGHSVSVRNVGPLEFPVTADVRGVDKPSFGGGRGGEGGGFFGGGMMEEPFRTGTSRKRDMMSHSSRRNGRRNIPARPVDTRPLTAGLSPLPSSSKPLQVDGGALETIDVAPGVQSVKLTIETQGMPIMAVVELWEGPGRARQVAKIHSEDGNSKPYVCMVETYGGVTLAVRNVGPLEFPLTVRVEAFA